MKTSACWSILSLVLFILCSFTVSASQYGDFTYTVSGSSIIISKYTGLGTAVTIPGAFDGRTVTSIGPGAFYNNKAVTSVIIPNSVTSIGENAFQNCDKLTGITIPNNVISIGNYAFEQCISLTSVTIPDSVTSVGGSVFRSCTALTSATIGDKVTSIGGAVFYYCSGLTSVTIGKSVTSIGGGAFYGCTNLAGVYFKGNAPSIGSDFFSGASKATVYYPTGTTGWEATLGGRPTVRLLLNQSITFPALPAKIFGDSDFVPGATASSGLKVSYASSSQEVATITSEGKLHIVGAGTTNITASQSGNADWNAAIPVEHTLVIDKRSQTIKFPVLTGKVYGDADFSPGATADSGLSVTYASSNPAVATVGNDKIHIVGIGSTVITASQAGNANWDAAPQAAQSLRVAIGTPVIVWPKPAAITYGTPLSAIQLNAQADIPGFFTYSPAAGSILPAGAQTLSATFTPTDTTHYSTAGKSVSITVNKAAATVTITGLSQVYNAQPRPVTVTAFPAGLSVDITYQGGTDVPVNVGSYAVTATVHEINFEGATGGTLVINKANQVIILPALSGHTYGEADFNPASSTSSLPISYTSSVPEVATIGNGKIHITGIGTSKITAAQAGDANWIAANPVEQILTVGTGIQTITFPDLSGHKMGDADFSPDATVNSGLTLTFTSSNPNVATIVNRRIHIAGIGTSIIIASQTGNTNWGLAEEVMQELTVYAGDQTISFPDLPQKSYGDADFAIGATSSSKLPVTYTSSDLSVVSIVNGKIHITGVGTSIITASQSGNANWNAAPQVLQTLTVAIGTPLISWSDPADIVYGTLLCFAQLNAQANIPGTFVYSPITGSKMAAGVQTLTAIFTPTDIAHYSTAGKSVSLKINKATATVTISGLSQFYNGQARPVTVTTVPAGLNVNITYAGGRNDPVDAGSYAVLATVDDVNFEGARADNLVIGKGNQSIIFPAIPDCAVGDADFAPGARVGSELPITYTSSNPNVATIVNGKIHIAHPGTITITASQAGDNNWNPADNVTKNLIVGKGPQTINFPPISDKSYGDADFAPGAAVSANLPVTYASSNTDVATIVSGKIHINSPGTSTITASQTGDDNWKTAADVDRKLTVEKGTPLITWVNPVPIVYGTPLSATQLNAISNVDGQSVYFPPIDSKLNVGAHALNVTFAPTDALLYTGAGKSVSLTVNEAVASLTIAPLKQDYTGNPRPVKVITVPEGLTVITTYKNIINGNISSDAPIEMGTYLVEATVSDPNAKGKKVDTLVIGKGIQMITLHALSGYAMGDADFNPGTATSGLPLKYTSSVPSVATILNGKIHLVGKGASEITATQAGNTNWNAATAVKQTLTVTIGSQTITFPALPGKLYGDADFSPGATSLSSSGIAITYTSSNLNVATIVSGKIHITGVGSATITAKQPGNANWNPATDATQQLTVEKGTPVITWANPATVIYGTALSAIQLNATVKAGLTAVPGTFVYNPATGAKLSAGAQTLKAAFNPTDSLRYNSVEKTVPLTVNKAVPTVTIAYLNQMYNGMPRPVRVTTVPANLNVVITYAGGPVPPTYVGSCAVVATVDDPNATIVTKTGTLVVAKGAQTIAFPNTPALYYGDKNCKLMATAAPGLTVTYSIPVASQSIATIENGDELHIVGAGTVTVTAAQAGNTNWNAATAVAKSIVIGKKIQTITFNSIPDCPMGTSDFDPGATAASELPVTYASSNLAVATILNGKIHLVGKGASEITATQAGNTNWNAATAVKQTLTVDKGNQTISFPALSAKCCGNADFAPGATSLSSSGIAIIYTSSNLNVATIVSGKIHITDVGESIITASQLGNVNWNAAADVTQKLTVGKGTPVITWANPAAITYGTLLSATQLNATANIPGKFTYTPVLGSKPTAGLQTLAVDFVPTDTSRYNNIRKEVTLTVNRAAATITLGALSQTYNGNAHPVTVSTVPAGLNVSITYAGLADVPVKVGSYAVAVTVEDSNYTGTKKTGMLVIAKGAQTITFTALPSMRIGDDDNPLKAKTSSPLTVCYSSSNPAIATIVSSAIHLTGTGTSIITATQPGDSNWNAATAVRQTQTVLIEGVISDLYAEMKMLLESHDQKGFFALFSADYIHQGKNLTDEFSESDFTIIRTFTYNITRIELDGDDAKVYGSFTIAYNNGNPSETWTEPDTTDNSPGFGWLRKGQAGWQVIGDQILAEVNITATHQVSAIDDHYFFRMHTVSSLEIKTITVSGLSIDAFELKPDPGWGGFTGFAGHFTSAQKPAIGTAYTFVIDFVDGRQATYRDTVKSWIAAAPVVSATTGASVVIKWTIPSVTNARSYGVTVYLGPAGESVPIWKSSEDLPLTRTSTAFNADGTATGSLISGKSYTAMVTVFDIYGNTAFRNCVFIMP